jgi:hypothetical protein
MLNPMLQASLKNWTGMMAVAALLDQRAPKGSK